MASFEDEEASTPPPPVATDTSAARKGWRKAMQATRVVQGFERGRIQQSKEEDFYKMDEFFLKQGEVLCNCARCLPVPPPLTTTRANHNQKFMQRYARTNQYLYSFLSWTIPD